MMSDLQKYEVVLDRVGQLVMDDFLRRCEWDGLCPACEHDWVAEIEGEMGPNWTCACPRCYAAYAAYISFLRQLEDS